jgi:hypothetical protein
MTAKLFSNNVRVAVTTRRSRMLGIGLRVSPAAEPSESELLKIAGLAAFLAAVPSALLTLPGQESGLREYVPILVLIVLVTLAVFAWGVPSALNLYESGPSAVALALSGLGVVTLLLFWTGLPAILATGGIVLGRTQLDVPEDRRLALAAIRIGAASVVLYLLLFITDLL